MSLFGGLFVFVAVLNLRECLINTRVFTNKLEKIDPNIRVDVFVVVRTRESNVERVKFMFEDMVGYMQKSLHRVGIQLVLNETIVTKEANTAEEISRKLQNEKFVLLLAFDLFNANLRHNKNLTGNTFVWETKKTKLECDKESKSFVNSFKYISMEIKDTFAPNYFLTIQLQEIILFNYFGLEVFPLNDLFFCYIRMICSGLEFNEYALNKTMILDESVVKFTKENKECLDELKKSPVKPSVDFTPTILSKCEYGPCCDMKTKEVIAASKRHICRPARDHECDIPEYCDGSSVECPADDYYAADKMCSNNEAYCYFGSCARLTHGTRLSRNTGFINRKCDYLFRDPAVLMYVPAEKRGSLMCNAVFYKNKLYESDRVCQVEELVKEQLAVLNGLVCGEGKMCYYGMCVSDVDEAKICKWENCVGKVHTFFGEKLCSAQKNCGNP